MLQLMDTYCGGWAILTIGLMECISIAWIYGEHRDVIQLFAHAGGVDGKCGYSTTLRAIMGYRSRSLALWHVQADVNNLVQ